MGKLTAFNFISLNGFYKGLHEDISWHRHGTEENEFAASTFKSGNQLLFGRVTYEMMASFWPTKEAAAMSPAVAEGMNNAEKIVFSRTLTEVTWKKTSLIKSDMVDAVRTMKETGTKDMTILGSGTIITTLAEHNLIDGYEIMIDPVVIPRGATVFPNIHETLNLELTGVKSFKSGVVLLSYRVPPAAFFSAGYPYNEREETGGVL